MSSFFDSTKVGAALVGQGVGRRDRELAVAWWFFSKPGEAMMLVRYGAPHLRIDHEGTVTEVAPPSTTRTDYAAAWHDEHERTT